ncbi:MAG TPA: PQQ-binding-like beta-propeller repeat protein [Chloroflexota bacterium]|nr:PQQ-binding-like beta-propeller repeat protein [Chloroflexota bacterium]
MRLRALLTLVIIFGMAAVGLVSPPSRGQAASGTTDQAVAFQENLTHSGAISGDALTPPLTKVWSANLGGMISYPLIAGGMVFVTVSNTVTPTNSPNYGSTIYALNEQTGATVWSVALGGTYYWSAAAYDNGAVFVINESGLLRALNATNGSLLWSAVMPGQYSFSSPPIAYNGVVYLSGAGTGGTVYAVDEASGAVLWTQSVENGDDSSPATDGTNLYVSYACPQAYAFTLKGVPVWHYSGPCEGGGGSTPVLNGGQLYVRWASIPNQGLQLDAATGAAGTAFTASAPPAFSGNIGAFLTGASSSSGGTLQLQDWSNPASPSVLWSFAGDGTLDSAPIIVNNDVYVGGSSGNLYALDMTTHQVVWSTNVGAAIPLSNDWSPQGQSETFGLGAGEGYLMVPAGNLLVAYKTVQPPSVTGTGTTLSMTEGTAFSGTVATFTDPNPNPSGDTATIAWGDGTTSVGTVTANGSGGYTVTASHTPAEEGSYTATVTVSNGFTSSSAQDAVTVSDAGLLSYGYSLAGAANGVSMTRTVLSFSDHDPGCAAGDYTATIAWGDGTTSAGTISAGSAACSFTVSGTHTYKTGSYTITTTVKDVGGSTTSSISTIGVKHH